MPEIRKFSVHPQIIYNLIVAQSGTLGKAALECVMNSIDAGASRVEIEVTNEGIRIQDDGQGFRSRKEIEDWFEVFGFPHEDGDRIYGKFGIGRAQLWSFCSTIWRTGTFEMDVDIKKRGLDYQLREGLKPAKGVLITGSFYTPLTTLEVASFQKELTELARYAQIPVVLNGKVINKDPTKEKWDFDTEDAWVRLTEGGQLSVYNLGVLVRRYSSYQFGCGGVVVTKPGVKLAVNMARNDILVAECQVWKRIRKLLQSTSDRRVRTKRTRMSEAELENAAKRFLAGEIGYEEISDFKLITDIVGRGHTLFNLCAGDFSQPVTKAELGSRLAERAHRSKLAFVLAPVTLERFDAESVEDLKVKLVDALREDPKSSQLGRLLSSRKTTEDVKSAAPTLREGYDVLKESELSKAERAGLRALYELSNHVGRALEFAGFVNPTTANRTVYLGVSDAAEAWTDGATRIVVERGQLALMAQGVGGFVGLANLLVHEYLHDADDTGSHTHDYEFYARYHAATCSHAGILNQAVFKGLHRWVTALHSFGLKVPRSVARHLDKIERLGREADSDGQAEVAPDGVVVPDKSSVS